MSESKFGHKNQLNNVEFITDNYGNFSAINCTIETPKSNLDYLKVNSLSDNDNILIFGNKASYNNFNEHLKQTKLNKKKSIYTYDYSSNPLNKFPRDRSSNSPGNVSFGQSDAAYLSQFKIDLKKICKEINSEYVDIYIIFTFDNYLIQYNQVEKIMNLDLKQFVIKNSEIFKSIEENKIMNRVLIMPTMYNTGNKTSLQSHNLYDKISSFFEEEFNFINNNKFEKQLYIYQYKESLGFKKSVILELIFGLDISLSEEKIIKYLKIDSDKLNIIGICDELNLNNNYKSDLIIRSNNVISVMTSHDQKVKFTFFVERVKPSIDFSEGQLDSSLVEIEDYCLNNFLIDEENLWNCTYKKGLITHKDNDYVNNTLKLNNLSYDSILSMSENISNLRLIHNFIDYYNDSLCESNHIMSISDTFSKFYYVKKNSLDLRDDFCNFDEIIWSILMSKEDIESTKLIQLRNLDSNSKSFVELTDYEKRSCLLASFSSKLKLDLIPKFEVFKILGKNKSNIEKGNINNFFSNSGHEISEIQNSIYHNKHSLPRQYTTYIDSSNI